jgi:hypothetical protein
MQFVTDDPVVAMLADLEEDVRDTLDARCTDLEVSAWIAAQPQVQALGLTAEEVDQKLNDLYGLDNG